MKKLILMAIVMMVSASAFAQREVGGLTLQPRIGIIAADLATDVSVFQQHYLMAGNYIRPFTMELGASIKF